jgi:hypothetical protein
VKNVRGMKRASMTVSYSPCRTTEGLTSSHTPRHKGLSIHCTYPLPCPQNSTSPSCSCLNSNFHLDQDRRSRVLNVRARWQVQNTLSASKKQLRMSRMPLLFVSGFLVVVYMLCTLRFIGLAYGEAA